MWFKKASARRQAIREDISDAEPLRHWWGGAMGYMTAVAGVFFVVACLLQFWPADPPPYREGELAPTDLRAPVEFSPVDKTRTEEARELARAQSPAVLVGNPEVFDHIRGQLRALKEEVSASKARSVAELPASVAARFPGLTDNSLAWLMSVDDQRYETTVNTFVSRGLMRLPLVTSVDRAAAVGKNPMEVRLTLVPSIENWLMSAPMQQVYVVDGGVEKSARAEVQRVVAEEFPSFMVAPITNYVMSLKEPTFQHHAKLTAALADRTASSMVKPGPPVHQGEIIVQRGTPITAEKYAALQAAHEALQEQVDREHPWAKWLSGLGRMLIVLILTVAGTTYIAQLTRAKMTTQRAWAVCGLLLVTLVVAKAGASALPRTLYFMGIMPTMLTSIILVIAYNQRFALGVASMHALLVTLTLGQNIDFFLTMLAGLTVFAFGLGEIRTRQKLIEVGVLASAVIFATVWAVGLARMAGSAWMPWGGSGVMDSRWVAEQSLAGACAGVGVAMLALFILPPAERIFRITTSMTLLELCDANKPLLQRLSQEAPGTFNHSLTVGIMAEAAGNAIGANGLLCRVGAYYHDVGKLSKPQYFIENQAAGHPNRHDKLSPAMSLLIIVGHVKDGIELAREYGLPWVIHQFIAQHHGTTLVEYFFHAAKRRAEQAAGGDGPEVSETEFRYPGPKPQTCEAAIVMICDGCESVVRSIDEPTPGRIEAAVHNMIMKRLMDGQFSECDLTLRDLSIIEETLVRTLVGVHHGRVAYPSDRAEAENVSDMAISKPA